MLLRRICDDSVRPLPMCTSSEVFASELYSILEEGKQSTEDILVLLETYFAYWETLLRNPIEMMNLHLIILVNRLEASLQEEVGTKAIEQYIQHVDSYGDDVCHELRIVAVKALGKLRYYPNLATPRGVEYVFSRVFTDQLRWHILRTIKKRIDISEIGLTFIQSKTPTYTDYFLLKNLNLDDWEKYLFHLMSQGFSTLEISSICKIPRETLYYEEKEIWNKLKQAW